MKMKRKAAGFFIVEILIVLVIVGILVVALLPNLSTYTARAKFVDNLTAASALKPAVELCYLNGGAPDGSGCSSGQNGIPAAIASGYGGSVAGVAVIAGGTIRATSVATTPFDNIGGVAGPFTYTIIPSYNFTNHVITWTVDTSAVNDCSKVGLC